MQRTTGRNLFREGRQLFAALASLSRTQPAISSELAAQQGSVRGYADNSLLKTALYDFNVEQGGSLPVIVLVS